MRDGDWQGSVGEAWAAESARTDRSFNQLAPALNAAILAAAEPGAITALDIGCGAGSTSIAFADSRTDARVIGVDISPDLIAVAKKRGEGRDNLRFVAGDAAQQAAAHGPANLIFSRHGVMFFADPVTAFAALHAASVPGAPLVFSCFRGVEHNPWATLLADAAGGTQMPGRPDAPGPFAFSDPALVTPLLAAAGWREIACTPVDYSYRAGQGDDPVADAMALLTRIGPAARLLREMSEADRPAALTRIETLLSSHRTGNAVDFAASAWLWSARA